MFATVLASSSAFALGSESVWRYVSFFVGTGRHKSTVWTMYLLEVLFFIDGRGTQCRASFWLRTCFELGAAKVFFRIKTMAPQSNHESHHPPRKYHKSPYHSGLFLSYFFWWKNFVPAEFVGMRKLHYCVCA